MAGKKERLRAILFLVMLGVVSGLLYSPLFDSPFNDEDDWFHLNFAKRFVDQGFFEADLIEMTLTAPELSGEHLRLIPLTQGYWVLNYALWGTNPRAHHFAAFFVFLACLLAVYLLSRQLAQNQYTALWCTALFALFPFNVNLFGVGFNISHLQASAYYLYAVVFYLYFLRTRKFNFRFYDRSSVYYALAMLFALFGYLALEITYSLPLLLFFLDLAITKRAPGINLKNSILRTAPFGVLLMVLLGIGFWLSRVYEVDQNLSQRYFQFVGIPLGKLLTLIPEGLATPFYEGFARQSVMVYGALIVQGALLVLAIVSWKKQDRVVIVAGVLWVFATTLILLKVIDRTVAPAEGEEKYLILAQVGFCLLLAALANPLKNPGKMIRMGQTLCLGMLIILYSAAIPANAEYFHEKNVAYLKVLKSLESAVSDTRMEKVIAFLPGTSDRNRELMQAAFLEHTFGTDDRRAWFLMIQGRLLPVVDQKLPDNRPADEIGTIGPQTGVPNNRNGCVKCPEDYEPITIPFERDVLLLAMDPATGWLFDVGQKLLPRLLMPMPPFSVIFDDFVQNNRSALTRTMPLAMPPQGWVIDAKVFRIDPDHGRF